MGYDDLTVAIDQDNLMLTEKEIAMFQQSVEQVEQLVKDVIVRDNDAQHAVHFTQQLHNSIDTVVEKAFTHTPAAQCRAGCAHCCKDKRVEVSMPEALYIAQQLQALSKPDLDDLIEHLSTYVQDHAKKGEKPANAVPQECTFLFQERCSIYAFRPAVCRKAHSQSVAACETHIDTIPQNLQVVAEAEALMKGTNNAYESQGLTVGSLELNQAILEALTQPGLQQDWFDAKEKSALVN